MCLVEASNAQVRKEECKLETEETHCVKRAADVLNLDSCLSTSIHFIFIQRRDTLLNSKAFSMGKSIALSPCPQRVSVRVNLARILALL